MYKYPVANPYTSPLHGCTYYLLNCSNPECSDLIDYYYDNKTTEKVDPAEKKQKKGGRNRPKLCMFQENIGEIAKEVEQYDYDRMTKINAEEFNKVWRKMIEKFIYHSRLWQDFMIDAAKRGQRLYSRSEEEEISEIRRRDIKQVADFFIKKGYSKQDVLIRCSTDYIVIYTTRYIADTLMASIMPYNRVWDILGGI
jgi:hypothetical protein